MVAILEFVKLRVETDAEIEDIGVTFLAGRHCHPDKPYLGALEATNPQTMIGELARDSFQAATIGWNFDKSTKTVKVVMT
jgi:hypothetical protein